METSSVSVNVVEGGGSDQIRAGAGNRAGEVEERRMKMKVMVAIDESEGSFCALKWALDNLFVAMASSSAGAATPQPHASLENEGMVFLVHVQPRFVEYGYPIIGPGGTGLLYF